MTLKKLLIVGALSLVQPSTAQAEILTVEQSFADSGFYHPFNDFVESFDGSLGTLRAVKLDYTAMIQLAYAYPNRPFESNVTFSTTMDVVVSRIAPPTPAPSVNLYSQFLGSTAPIHLSFDGNGYPPAEFTVATGQIVFDPSHNQYFVGGRTGDDYMAVVDASYRGLNIHLDSNPLSDPFLLLGDYGTKGSYKLTYVYEAAPEPATWATMVAGFGLAGLAMRRRVFAVIA